MATLHLLTALRMMNIFIRYSIVLWPTDLIDLMQIRDKNPPGCSLLGSVSLDHPNAFQNPA